MEFPELGTHCTRPDCKTLDFLPFTCIYCSKLFCKHHFLAEAHQCGSVVTPNAPEDAGPKNHTCSMNGCFTSDVVAMLCVKCRLHFCLTHRYHSCFENSEEELQEARKRLKLQQEKVAETFKQVSDKIDENIEKSKRSGRHSTTALKVQLMRLKGKAKGEKNIPEPSRVYFMVYPPKLLAAPSKPVYVSSDWTIGRVIDSVSSLVDVINKNNEAHSKKLRLFKASDGCPISVDMTDNLGNLLKNNNLHNGESLILEYVEPDCILKEFKINNTAEYL